MSVETVAGQQPEAQVAEENKEEKQEERTDWFKSLPEEAQKEIIKLRNESGKYRTKAKSVEDDLKRLKQLELDVQVEKEKKMKEEGKLNELLEARQKELDELKPKAQKASEMEEYFNELLENEFKGLNEKYVNIIKSANISLKEKLETARQFRLDINKTSSSPAAIPPGGEDMKFDTLVEQYQKETDVKKKMQMLFDVEQRDPSLYQKLIKGVK